jgi:predicted nucleic acid-binding protein
VYALAAGGLVVTVTVQLEPMLEARLLAEAHAQGLPIETYLASVLAQVAVPKGRLATTLQDFETGLDELAEGSEKLPVLPPEAYRRDSIYGEEWRVMAYLADTNVLLRLLQRGDPDHEAIRSALRTLYQRGEQVCFSPQNLVEFWCVCTRPITANGFGLTVVETDRRARVLERLLTLLPDGPAVHVEWRRLVVADAVSGVQVHDARLVALMRVNALTSILTLDVGDFKRYGDISAVHPRDI